MAAKMMPINTADNLAEKLKRAVESGDCPGE